MSGQLFLPPSDADRDRLKYMCVEFSLDRFEQQLQGVNFILYLCSFFVQE